MNIIAPGESIWKIMLGVSVFAVFACVGIAHVVNPDWFIKRSGVLKGGEMLKGWNRFGFRYSGAALAAFAMYMLYRLLRDVFAN